MAGFDLGDYVTVPQREALFYKNHPDGRICASPPVIRTIGERVFIEVTASVYRSPEDFLPCVASAWEPFPGRTPYTKDSEMMNAETSAIGRALAAAGIAVNRSLASAEEVRNRQAERDVPPEPTMKAKPKAAKLAIDDLVSRMNALVPAEVRVEAKAGFADKFGHPSKLSADNLEAAILFVAEWEDRADAPALDTVEA